MIKIMETGKFFFWAAMIVAALALSVSFTVQAAELGRDDWSVQIDGALRVSYNEEDCGSTCRDLWHNAESDTVSNEGSNTYLAGDISQVAISGFRRMDSGIRALFMTEWRVDTQEGQNGEQYMAEFEKLMDNNPDTGIDHILVGRSYSSAAIYFYRNGKISKSKGVVEKGLSYAPDNIELKLKLSSFD